MEAAPFRLGEWTIDPSDGSVVAAGTSRRLEPQLVTLLLFLASRAGTVVTRQEIFDTVWGGVLVSEDALTGAIHQLRRALDDDARSPRFIETVPKRGYRLLVAPSPAAVDAPGPIAVDAPVPATVDAPRPAVRSKLAGPRLVVAIALAGAALAGSAAWFALRRAPDPPLRSLAVLPFVSASADPSDRALGEGLAAIVLAELRRLAPLRAVPGRSLPADGTALATPVETGRVLGVDAVLDGTVTRRGDRVRVELTLHDVARGSVRWSAIQDRQIGDLLELRAVIGRSIADELRPVLAPPPAGTGGSARSVAAGALEAYLAARAALDMESPLVLPSAQMYFERAIALEPGFAEAHAGLADCFVAMMFFGPGRPADRAAQAREAARAALALDPGLAEARAASAAVLAFAGRDTAAAEDEFRRALALDPGLVRAHRQYAVLLSLAGRHAEAIDHARRAVELDPLNLPAYYWLAEVLVMARRFDEVQHEMERILALQPGLAYAHQKIALVRWLTGDERGAYAAMRAGLAAEGVTPAVLDGLDRRLAAEGAQGVFRSIARYVEQQPVETPFRDTDLAVLFAACGEREKVFAHLERAAQSGSPFLPWVLASPYLDPVRDDPRLAALRARTGR